MSEGGDLGGSPRANSCHRLEIRTRRGENAHESSKLSEQRACSSDRDARSRSERLFGWGYPRASVWPLGIPRTVSGWLCDSTRAARADPVRGIVGVFAATHGHPEVGHGENESSQGFGGDAAAVDRSALNQEIRPASGPPQLPNLEPEATVVHRLVQIRDGLPLDDRKSVNHVVTSLEAALFDVYAEADQLCGDSRRTFVNIGNEMHTSRLPRRLHPYRSNSETKASRAISQGEMA